MTTAPGTPPPPPPPPPITPPSGGANDLIYPGSPPKDPAVTVIINIFLSGLGQVYLGQVGKGLVIFFGSAMLWTGVMVLLAFCVGLLFVPFGVAIYAAVIVDGYLQARELQAGRPVGQWTWFSAHR